MVTSVTLPNWLDDFIFNELGAKYCRSNSDMTVIDWDRSDILNYLGTYFPRSYAEAYCIAKDYLQQLIPDVLKKDTISIFDFCCGTGGEMVGLLTALNELPQKPKSVHIDALDGNQYSLRLSETVIQELSKRVSFDITYRPISYKIDDIFDLDILKEVIARQYDVVISFKAICEFVTKDRFENQNPYESVARFFLPKINESGIFLLADLTSKNIVSQEWLTIQMDKGLNSVSCNVILKNDGYNQQYHVTHSQQSNDISKIAWRIFRNIINQ